MKTGLTKHSGFTLIEVLVASFILFISLAIFTLVFRSALISSSNAGNSVKESANVELILNKVTQVIKRNHDKSTLSGEGTLRGTYFRWSASVSKKANPPARYFGEQLIQLNNEIKLWKVRLIVDQGAKSKSYKYDEVSW